MSAVEAQPFALAFAQIKTTYGPVVEIGRMLMEMEEAVRARGIHLEIQSMVSLAEINRRHAPGWPILAPLYDATYNELNDENSFALVGRDSSGQIVLTHGARLFDWTETNFSEEARSLRLFYSNPSKYALRAERCEPDILVGPRISGLVAFSGAAWQSPKYRSRGLIQLMPRIARLYGHTLWEPDYTITMMSHKLIARGVYERCGYGNIERTVHWINPRTGTDEFGLAWIRKNQLLGDAQRMSRALAKDDGLGEIDIAGTYD